MAKFPPAPAGPLRAWMMVAAATLLSPAHAFATDAPPGCDAPGPSPNGRTFYIDPVRGSPSGDGSKERPWRTLAEVLDEKAHLVATRAYLGGSKNAEGPQPINPAGPIKPGDTLLLMSGDHGRVEASRYINSSYIWVAAGDGQTPVIEHLKLRSSSHWGFQGLKFQGVRPEADKFGPLVGVENHGWQGPADNVAFIDDSFSTEDSTAQWTPLDWVNRPYAAGFRSDAACTTVIGGHFYNLRDVIGAAGENTLLQGNRIENFGNDAIDMAASGVIIRGNHITNGRHTPTEELHADGIQGWTAKGATNRNVVIEDNWIVNLNPATDNYIQGISIFDGEWDGLRVANNVVINNAWHAIALYGVNHVSVVNNTVVSANPAKFDNWIKIAPGKEGRASQDVVVRNNIATQIVVEGERVAVDHNIAARRFALKSESESVNIERGSFGDHNAIAPSVFRDFFDYNPNKGTFDLRPSRLSPAREAGSEKDAPAKDIEGRPRTPPPDIGAFAR